MARRSIQFETKITVDGEFSIGSPFSIESPKWRDVLDHAWSERPKQTPHGKGVNCLLVESAKRSPRVALSCPHGVSGRQTIDCSIASDHAVSAFVEVGVCDESLVVIKRLLCVACSSSTKASNSPALQLRDRSKRVKSEDFGCSSSFGKTKAGYSTQRSDTSTETDGTMCLQQPARRHGHPESNGHGNPLLAGNTTIVSSIFPG